MGRSSFVFSKNSIGWNDARWQDAITKLHNSLVAAGMTHIPFTGELDLASAIPTANDSFARGGRLYAFSDPDQASFPVIVRIDPTLTRSKDVFTFVISAAFSYNPSTGALTGNASNGLWVSGSSFAQGSEGDATTYICHGDGYLHIMHHVNAQNRNMTSMAVVERPMVWNGNSQRGIFVGNFYGAGPAAPMQLVPRSGTVPTFHNSGGTFFSQNPNYYADTNTPWQWTFNGDTDIVPMPLMFPMFGELGVLRLLYLPITKGTAEAVMNMGHAPSKIEYMFAGDRGPLYVNTSLGWAIRWEP